MAFFDARAEHELEPLEPVCADTLERFSGPRVRHEDGEDL